VALTARPRRTASPGIEWLLRHFGDWFQTFSYVPSERPGELPGRPDRSKGDFLAWLSNVDYFIDDCTENVKTAGDLGIAAFAVSRPWNRSASTLMDILKTILKENDIP